MNCYFCGGALGRITHIVAVPGHPAEFGCDGCYRQFMCQEPGCANLAVPGTERCQPHSICYLCGKSLAEEIAHVAAAAGGRPVELACNACYQRLMESVPANLPSCDGCGAAFGAGCECVENKRAIGRGERREP